MSWRAGLVYLSRSRCARLDARQKGRGPLRIALAQIGSVPGAFSATVDRMLAMAEQAQRTNADLVVFPATVLSGAYPLGLTEHRSYQLDLLGALEAFAARVPVPCAVPAYVSDSTAGYTEVFMCAEGIAFPLRRRELSCPGAAYESAADAPATCTIDEVTVRFLAGDATAVPAEADCDVAVALSPMPYCFEDTSSLGVYGVTSGLLAPLANGSACWFALVQGVGAYDDVVLAGGSFAATPGGVVAAACPLHEEALAVFDVEPLAADEGDALEPQVPAIEPIAGTLVGTPLQNIAAPTDDERTGQLWRALMVSVRDYVRKSGFTDAVVGLSGGIDSAVVAALAADALGPEHVLGVLMPGPYSSTGSVDDSLELAARLGIQTRTLPIATLFELGAALLADALGDDLAGTARENLQARLRGTLLMTLANARGALVLNTGNKSESGMGYSTLYGDTVGAYAPLADVYKGMVFRLATWRNSRGPLAVIPQVIIDKPPSAELAEDQTDEASFGATYDEVDAILSMHVDRSLDAQDIVNAGYDPAVVNRVLGACATAEFKRRQEPFGPVVSLRPFIDRGWPVVLAWRDRASEPCSVQSPTTDGQVLGAWTITPASLSELADLVSSDADFDFTELRDDLAEAAADDRPEIDEVLDAMLMRAAQQEQVAGVVGDVAFGTFVSGRGPDLDDVMGVPLFSKN